METGWGEEADREIGTETERDTCTRGCQEARIKVGNAAADIGQLGAEKDELGRHKETESQSLEAEMVVESQREQENEARRWGAEGRDEDGQ